MANRMTDTTIWKKQRWFKKLSRDYKLVWRYLTDVCDHAGVWKIDMPELLEDIGGEYFDFIDFVNTVNHDFDKHTGSSINRERILKFDADHVWLTGFMAFQYGGKSKTIKNSKGNFSAEAAIKILKELNLFELGINKRFFSLESYQPPSGSHQDPIQPLTSPQPAPSQGDNNRSINILTKDPKEKKESPREKGDLNPPKNIEGLKRLTDAMVEVFVKAHDKKRFNEIDLSWHSGLVANLIAEEQGWPVESIGNGRLEDVLNFWKEMIEFTRQDKFSFSRSIQDLSDKNEFHRLIEKMNYGKQKPPKSSVGKTLNRDQL